MSNPRGSRNQGSHYPTPGAGSVPSSRSIDRSRRVHPYPRTQPDLPDRARQQQDSYSTNLVNMTGSVYPANLTSSSSQPNHQSFIRDRTLATPPAQRYRTPQQPYTNANNAWNAVESHAQQGSANMPQSRQPAFYQSSTALPWSQQENIMHDTGAQPSLQQLGPAQYTPTSSFPTSQQLGYPYQAPGMPLRSASSTKAFDPPRDLVIPGSDTTSDNDPGFAVTHQYVGHYSPRSYDSRLGSQMAPESTQDAQGSTFRNSDGLMTTPVEPSQAPTITNASAEYLPTGKQAEFRDRSCIPLPTNTGNDRPQRTRCEPKLPEQFWSDFWASISGSRIVKDCPILPRHLFDKIPRQVENDDQEVKLTAIADAQILPLVQRRLDQLTGFAGVERKISYSKEAFYDPEKGTYSYRPTLLELIDQSRQWDSLTKSRLSRDLDRYVESGGTKVSETLGYSTLAEVRLESGFHSALSQYKRKRKEKQRKVEEEGLKLSDRVSDLERQLQLLEIDDIKTELQLRWKMNKWAVDLRSAPSRANGSESPETKASHDQEYESYVRSIMDVMSNIPT